MRLHVKKVNVIVEQELPDGRTYPVVAVTMGKYKREAVEMNVWNWSSQVNHIPPAKVLCVYSPIFMSMLQLTAKAGLTLETSYYNVSHDAWEPILEPVVDPEDETHYSPWTLQAEVFNWHEYTTECCKLLRECV